MSSAMSSVDRSARLTLLVRSSTITFATEPVTASLRSAIAASSASHDSSRRGSRVREEDELELDEVEIQKGLSQLAKGLQFLHESAKLVHGNLTPDSVIINAKVSHSFRLRRRAGG